MWSDWLVFRDCSFSLPPDPLSQCLLSYLGFSYLGLGVCLDSCPSKAQPLLLTSDTGSYALVFLIIIALVIFSKTFSLSWVLLKPHTYMVIVWRKISAPAGLPLFIVLTYWWPLMPSVWKCGQSAVTARYVPSHSQGCSVLCVEGFPGYLMSLEEKL